MRKSDSGIIGSARRDSTQMKAAKRHARQHESADDGRAPEAALRPLHERPDERADGDRPSTAPYTSRCRWRSSVRHVSRETSVKTTVTTATGC